MKEISENKPCLVQTGQGFSVTYKNRLLYSKYNPGRNITTLIEKTPVLPGTVILCISPVLEYGLELLASRLPENCLMIGIEKEEELYNLALSQTKNLFCVKKNIYTLFNNHELNNLPSYLENLSLSGKYRRVIAIEFSGGTQFNSEYYNSLFEASRNSINQFWKNRVTLVKFGRKYSANLFKNIRLFSKGIYSLKTDKTIIVSGAGESAVETLLSIKEHSSEYFIIAVDAALQTLKALKIRPNAVICEESQSVIKRAFTGCRDFFDYLFVSSTVNPSVSKINPEKNIFYTPLFLKTGFLEHLADIKLLPEPQEPLGSVGLSAVNAALKIRKNEDIPVFVTGLDFSFSTGQTHAKMSFHEKNRRIKSSKIKTMECYESSFSKDSRFLKGKNDSTVITSTSLYGYAELFRYKFPGIKNLYDAGKTGLSLSLPEKEPFITNKNGKTEVIKSSTPTESVKGFLSEEKNALLELKDIFTGKIQLSEEERTKKITALLKNREYLFLHFPDGFTLSLSQDFLNRIRIEIDYFLKLL